MHKLITDHMDIWTAAKIPKKSGGRGRGANSKKSPHGIQKLRELILELAVRGKLVPQDPNDEPASELLKRIAAEKARLIKDGKLKKQKRLPKIAANEMPFQTPSGWGWAYLSDVLALLTDGDHQAPPRSLDGIPFLVIGNLNRGSIRFDDCRFVPEKYYKSLDWGRKPTRGDMLYTVTGSYGIPIVVDQDKKFCVQRHVAILKTTESSPYLYLILFLRSKFSFQYSSSIATGIAQKTVPLTGLRKMPISLPPLEEQHRIVAKVDELMALCDQLEQEQTENSEAHQALVEALLATLTQAEDNRAFQQAWQRIADHFDTLFTTEPSIDQLKQTILQLAVMGKLVPQDPTDEPASELLKKITAEKAQRIKSGILIKQKPLPSISDKKLDFDLPSGWASVRLGEIGGILGGGTPSKANDLFWNGSIPWVSPKDMKISYLSETADYVTRHAIKNSSVKLIPENSLLLVVRGMILAHSFPVAINTIPVTINQDMKALLVLPEIKDYLLRMIQGLKHDFVSMVDRSSHGTCKLISEKLWNKWVTLPPVEEQRRIVAKVDELMAMCDVLKAELQESQTTQLQLADSIVEQAVP